MSDLSDLSENRLVKTFAELRAAGKQTVLPFLTAGYPDLETTAAMLTDLESRGVRICELGVPFSDPIADGPTIQASYTDALGCGVTSEQIFDRVRAYRAGGGQMALIAMVSYSIVYRHGVEQYLAAAREAGIDGMIVPDLPLDEAGDMETLTASLGLCNILLISPTTPPARQVEIAKHSSGFIYFMSIAGITGERSALPAETISAVAELRTHTETPVCVGFGISTPDMVQTVCEVADGAIVGSAIIHRITDAKDASRDEQVARVGQFVGELLAGAQ